MRRFLFFVLFTNSVFATKTGVVDYKAVFEAHPWAKLYDSGFSRMRNPRRPLLPDTRNELLVKAANLSEDFHQKLQSIKIQKLRKKELLEKNIASGKVDTLSLLEQLKTINSERHSNNKSILKLSTEYENRLDSILQPFFLTRERSSQILRKLEKDLYTRTERIRIEQGLDFVLSRSFPSLNLSFFRPGLTLAHPLQSKELNPEAVSRFLNQHQTLPRNVEMFDQEQDLTRLLLKNLRESRIGGR